MPVSRFERFLPLAGILAGLCFAATILLTRDTPEVTEGDGSAYVQWMTDHAEVATASGFISGYLCVLLLLFACAVRVALRSGEPGESTYSSAAFAGGLGVALSAALMGWGDLAGAAAADDGRGEAVRTLGYLGNYSWIPWVAASAVFFIATGLGGLRTAALPKPLAIATLVLGIGCLLGLPGILVYLVTPIWLVVTGVVLYRRTAAAPALDTPRRSPAGSAAD